VWVVETGIALISGTVAPARSHAHTRDPAQERTNARAPPQRAGGRALVKSKPEASGGSRLGGAAVLPSVPSTPTAV